MRFSPTVLALLGLLTAACDDGSPDPASPATDASDSGAGPEVSGDAPTVDTPPAQPCNGFVHLCDKRLDEVVFVRTNNGHAALELGYNEVVAAHRHAIPRQLADGVRAPSIDIHLDGGELKLCHGTCMLGSTPLATGLAWFTTFIEENPREVLIVDIESKAPTDDIVAALADAGLDAHAHSQTPGEPWPTLGELIGAGRRLVLLTSETAGPAWLHPHEQFVFGTPWEHQTKDDLACTPETAPLDDGLYKLSLTVQDPIATEAICAELHTTEFLLPFIEACTTEVGKQPTLLSVDFYAAGEILAVAAALNAPQH